MFDKMFIRYKLAEDDYREIMIIQKRSVPNNTSKKHKVLSMV